MAVFPALVPSSREFVLGVIPVRTYQTLAGTVWKRQYGNRPTAHKLTMEFQNISDAKVRSIVEHFYGQNCTVDQFNLPAQASVGVKDAALITLLRNPANNRWVYTGPPRVRSIVPGISTVSVELNTELTY